MRIIDRHILRHFIVPFLFSIVTIALLFIVIDLFDNINQMVKYSIDPGYLLGYYLNYVPFVITQGMPIATLISIAFMFVTFNRNNEITAMRASGMSIWKILRPLFVCGILISIASFIITDRIVPDSMLNVRILKDVNFEKVKMEKKKGQHEKILENIAFYGTKGRIFYARSYNVYSQVIGDLIVHEQDTRKDVVSKTTAREVHWKDGRWVAKDAMFFKLSKDGKIIDEPFFYESEPLNIDETPIDFGKRRHQTEFMSYGELRDYIKALSFGSANAVIRLKVNLQNKVAFPFVNLVVVFIAAPFALLSGRHGSSLIGIAMVSIIAIVLIYYAFMSISLAMGNAGFLYPWFAAWVSNFLFAGGGTFVIWRMK